MEHYKNHADEERAARVQRYSTSSANRENIQRRVHHQQHFFTNLASQWTQECKYGCGYFHLDSTKGGQLLNCCFKGRLSPMMNDRLYDKFRLLPLPTTIRHIMIDNIISFSSLSSTYNNVLALAVTGVRNDHGGGYERRVGNHSVTMNGSTFHFLPKASTGTNPSGGLSYFVFDHTAAEAINNHVNELHRRRQRYNDDGDIPDEKPIDPSYHLRANIVMQIKEELTRCNPYCSQLHYIGRIVHELDYDHEAVFAELRKSMPIVTASLRSKVQYFDVAHFTADRASGERILTFHSIAGSNGSIDMNSPHVEPLIYPLLFFNGERGWGDADKRDIPYNRYLASRLLMPELESLQPDASTCGPHYLTIEHETDFVEIVRLIHSFDRHFLFHAKVVFICFRHNRMMINSERN
jgi:hypothetical protein